MTTTRYGYKDPRAAYGDFKNNKYATDAPSLDADLFNRLASLLNDTVAKGAPRAQDTPDMTIYIPPMVVYFGAVPVVFAGGDSPAMVDPEEDPRYDLIYMGDDGIIAILEGEEGGGLPEPEANTFPICYIYHRPGSTSIEDDDDTTNSYIFRDDRPLLQAIAPRGGGASVEAIVPFDAADGEVEICTVPAGSFVTWIGKIPSATPYDAGTVTIGSEGDESGLMSSTQVGAQSANPATKVPQKFYAAETVIKAFVTPSGATEGSFTIKLKYE